MLTTAGVDWMVFLQQVLPAIIAAYFGAKHGAKGNGGQ